MLKRFVMTCWALVIPVLASIGAEELIPVDTLFKDALVDDLKISPDGKTIALRAPFKGYYNIAVYDVEKKTLQPLTQERDDVYGIRWVNNDRIIYRVGGGGAMDLSAARYLNGLYAVNKDGSDFRVLVEPARPELFSMGVSPSKGNQKQSKGLTNFLHRYDKDPNQIIVSNNGRVRNRPDLYLLNVYSGVMKLFLRNPGMLTGFFLDSGGEPVLGFEQTPEGKSRIHQLKEGEWRVISESDNFEFEWAPFYLEQGSNTLYVTTNRLDEENAVKALYTFDLETLTFNPEPVLRDPVYDVDGIALEGVKSDRLVGIYYQRDKPTIHYLDEQHRRLQAMLDEALPGTFNLIASVDDEGHRAVVESYSDVQFPTYYMLDLKNLGLSELVKSRPWITPDMMQPKRPISFKARDGRTIHGYLTLPRNYRESNPVPLIVNPHGGPWARDEWGMTWHFDAEPQFYANRGFAVLQVNFRGSTGYGWEHYADSFKKVPDMMTDLIDGIDWAVEQGYVDPNNIGLSGASWGGYSTMYCLTKWPEKFRFGVNMMGVVDVIEQIETYDDSKTEFGEIAKNWWRNRIGDPRNREERALLREWSPINHIDRLDDPVFIYHGTRDMNVDIEQARILESALRKRRKPYQKLILTDELHSASGEENRLKLYNMIDEFIRPFRPKLDTDAARASVKKE